MRPIIFNCVKTFILSLTPPYHFNANFHKPSHFPSSDNAWEKDKYWITMAWKGEKLGLKFENLGSIEKPKIKLTVYSSKKLSEEFYQSLLKEVRWRFNFDQDISEFVERFKKDKILGPVIGRFKGMKPVAGNSLYETLIIYFVLQNATVRRSVQMLESLFSAFGKKVKFDGKILSTFWEPQEIADVSEEKLRSLKLGYRAKFIAKLTEQFVSGQLNEFALRKMGKEEVEKEALKLYGVGPASVEYLLFEHFYFCDSLKTIPPWEQKILSRLIFKKELVPVEKILKFFRRYKGWEKLAFHYLWEDLFWKHKKKKIDWLEKEIRL